MDIIKEDLMKIIEWHIAFELGKNKFHGTIPEYDELMPAVKNGINEYFNKVATL